MRYTLIHFPGDLRIEEKSIPEVEQDKVLVKVEACGRIKSSPLITHKFPLNRIDEAMAIARGGEAVKVVVVA